MHGIIFFKVSMNDFRLIMTFTWLLAIIMPLENTVLSSVNPRLGSLKEGIRMMTTMMMVMTVKGKGIKKDEKE